MLVSTNNEAWSVLLETIANAKIAPLPRLGSAGALMRDQHIDFLRQNPLECLEVVHLIASLRFAM